MSTFLITGGNGYIGSNLIKYLLDEKHKIIVFHRKESNLHNIENFKFSSAYGDFSELHSLENNFRNAIKGCDGVFNLAACGSSHARDHDLRETINVEAVKIISKVCRENKVRLVHVSSSTAIGYPSSGIADENFKYNGHSDHYSLTKNNGEKVITQEIENGLDAVIVNPGSVFGGINMKNNQKDLFVNIRDSKVKIYPPGGLCLTYIDDIVRGVYLSFLKGINGKRYILGGHNITYKQYFSQIALNFKSKPPYIRLPKLILPMIGWAIEMLFKLLNKETILSKNTATMISKNLFYSSELAKKELGYDITDWESAIQETVEQLS